MTLEQKIAQLFLARCPESQAVELLSQYQLGGYMLYNRDFHNRTREEVIENIQSYQKAVTIPMLIAVDEEGGSVMRLGNNSEMGITAIPSMESVGDTEDISQAYRVGNTIGSEISQLGFNLDFAPVADVNSNCLLYTSDAADD